VTSWVEVSERRLRANTGCWVDAAGGDTAVLAVVKANAYGHGAGVCAPVLAQAGAEWLGVGMRLRARPFVRCWRRRELRMRTSLGYWLCGGQSAGMPKRLCRVG